MDPTNEHRHGDMIMRCRNEGLPALEFTSTDGFVIRGFPEPRVPRAGSFVLADRIEARPAMGTPNEPVAGAAGNPPLITSQSSSGAG